MPTRSYKDSMKAMVDENPELGTEMLEEALNSLLSGELDEGRLLLRQFVNATMGFKELAERTGKRDKNLMRSLSAEGNPTAANLFEIVQACIQAEGVTVATHVQKRADAGLTQNDRA